MTYVGVAVILLILEYMSGALIQFPIVLVVPVILASWFCAPYIGYIFAVGMAVIRLSFNFFWDDQLALEPEIIHAIINVCIFLFLAYITGKAVRKTQEAKLLQGILPVCTFCKMIRDKDDKWYPIEDYIEKYTDANFSHGICPECAQFHYGDILNKTNKTAQPRNS